MAIKSVYVCDNCGKEEVFQNKPIKITDLGTNFIITNSSNYTIPNGLVGEQHFCCEDCIGAYIIKNKKEDE